MRNLKSKLILIIRRLMFSKRPHNLRGYPDSQLMWYVTDFSPESPLRHQAQLELDTRRTLRDVAIAAISAAIGALASLILQ